MTEDQRAVLEFHVSQERIRHLTASQLSQVNYELQVGGYVVEAGCCGNRALTEKAHKELWELYRAGS